jgi:hypothetical protein
MVLVWPRFLAGFLNKKVPPKKAGTLAIRIHHLFIIDRHHLDVRHHHLFVVS